MVAAALDVIAAKILDTGRITAAHESVLADTQASAHAGRRAQPELRNGASGRLDASLPAAARESGSNLLPFRARTR